MLAQSEDIASQAFFAALARRLSTQAFETWFRPLRITRFQPDGVLRIAVPNPAVRDWILAKYSTVLTESLLEIQVAGCRIEWALPQGDKVRAGAELIAQEDVLGFRGGTKSSSSRTDRGSSTS